MKGVVTSLAVVAAASAGTVTEFVGLQPAGGGGAGTVLEWVEVTYPQNVTSVSEITMTNASGTALLVRNFIRACSNLFLRRLIFLF